MNDFFIQEIPTLSTTEESDLWKFIERPEDDEQYVYAFEELRNFKIYGQFDNLIRAVQFFRRPDKVQHKTFALLKSEFISKCPSANIFFKRFENCKLLVLHMTCESRLDLAEKSVQSFTAIDGVMHLNLIGQNTTNKQNFGNDLINGFQYDDKNKTLIVPTSDQYEDLTHKIFLFLFFIGMLNLNAQILKLDDDIHCSKLGFNSQTLIDLAISHDYVGKMNNGMDGIYRWWHLNKCQNEDLNRKPFTRWIDNWANGGTGYLLSRKACVVLSKSYIYYNSEYHADILYEDVMVGRTLKYHKIKPYDFDLIRNNYLEIIGIQD